MNKHPMLIGAALVWVWASAGFAGTLVASIYYTDKDKVSVGHVVFKDSKYGLLISPDLSNLPPGMHGMHLHQNPDCGDMGNHAGGHFDPAGTQSHKGPYGQGHLGDLPSLYVDLNGHATQTTLAPRLHTSDMTGLTLMVHANGDTYSDTPALGGGGGRMACGVIEVS